MKQVEIRSPEDVRLTEGPRPRAGKDEAVIAVAVAGICGSDIHAYHGRHPFIPLPVVPGHEFAGTVAEVGKDVTGIRPGERVTVEPSLACGRCYLCRQGRYNICNELKVIGCQSAGAMAEYIAVPANKVILLPDSVTWEEAAMVEPLAVGVRVFDKTGIPAGGKLLILGAGAIGLMTLQAAKAGGAGKVIICDPIPERLARAKELGADEIVNPQESDVGKVVEKKFGQDGVDAIAECAGVAATIREAVRIARKGSRIVLAGVFEEEVSLALGLVQDRELEVVGTLMYADKQFPAALQLVAEGKVKVKPLITHRFPLSRAAEAFAAADNRKPSLKVLLEVTGAEK